MADTTTNILLYGDSFFWGVNADTGQRYKSSERIGKILQAELGDDYAVIEEGLRGRTMFGDNGWFPERDGLAQFGPIFASQLPVDVIVIMLGTNDLNSKTTHTPQQIAVALDEYQAKMQFWCDFMKYNLPEVIVIAPPAIDTASLKTFKEIFAGSSEYIEPLAEELARVSKECDYGFIDSRTIIKSVGTDGIHVTADQNRKLALAIKKVITTKL